MVLMAVVYGDWRPSVSGARLHYGWGATSLCGAPRQVNDDKILRDKCERCVRSKKKRKGEIIS